MATSFKLLRKLLILAVGLPVFVLGLILIPLPGPGLVICFIGLYILSFEFSVATKYRDKILHTLKNILAEAKRRAEQAKNP